jgi:uncharacterized membrane protein
VEIFTRLGAIILSRWFHVLAGITWIGLLYFFNFVQTPAFAQFEPGARNEAFDKLVPRALWWFRWAAALTLLSGVAILGADKRYHDSDFFKSLPGTSILTGMLFAVTMFLNVWLVIWPNQKVVIANARGVLAGREPDPNAAASGRKGLLASRTNTLFSITMVWFMVATSHFYGVSNHFKQTHIRDGMTIVGPGRTNLLTYWGIAIVVWVLIEANALGFLGGTAPGGTRAPLDDHRRTIIAGFVLWALFYVLWEVLFRA